MSASSSSQFLPAARPLAKASTTVQAAAPPARPPLERSNTAPDPARSRWRNVRYSEGNQDTGLEIHEEPNDKARVVGALNFGETFVASEIREDGNDMWLKKDTQQWVKARGAGVANCVDMTRWQNEAGRIPASAYYGQDYPVGMFTAGFPGDSSFSLVSASGDAFWREVNIEMLCRDISTATLFEKGWEGDAVFQDWVAYYAMNISKFSTGKRFVVIVKPTSEWRKYSGGRSGVALAEVKDVVGRAQWRELSWIHKVQAKIHCRWSEIEFITAFAFLRKYCHWSDDDCKVAANEKIAHVCSLFGTAEAPVFATEIRCAFWTWMEAFDHDQPDVEDAVVCQSLLQKLALQETKPKLELQDKGVRFRGKMVIVGELEVSLQGKEGDSWTKLLAAIKEMAPEAHAAVLQEPSLFCMREHRQRSEGLQARLAELEHGLPGEEKTQRKRVEQLEEQVRQQAGQSAQVKYLEEQLKAAREVEQRQALRVQELEAQVKRMQLEAPMQPPRQGPQGPQFVITAGNDGVPLMWSFATGQTLREFRGHASRSVVWSTCLSSDSQFLFTTSTDCTARMWSVQSGECLRIFHHQRDSAPNWACVSPDLKYLCTAVNDRTAKIWHVDSGSLLEELQHMGCVNSVCMSPDGKALFTASDDNLGRMWHVPSGKLMRKYDGRNSLGTGPGNQGRGLYSCSLTADGTRFFTAAFDGQVTMFDVPSGELLHAFMGTGSAKNVCASPSGDRVFIGRGDDGGSVVEMCCTESGKVLRVFEGHARDVTAQWVSPDGLWLCSSSLDGTAKIWNTTTGEAVRTYRGHKSYVQGIVGA